MTPETSRYSLKGGPEGYERLLLLAKKSWPATEALLDRAGVSPGMKVVDVGCGGGAVSFEIAARVGPRGSVLGLDLNREYLDLARQAAMKRGVTNVEFRVQRVEAWNEPESFDVAYSRFLLHHLSDPNDVISRMWNSVRPGGLLVLEDPDHSTWTCHPPEPSFEFFRRTLGEVVDRTGGDYAFGRKLYAACRRAGVTSVNLSVVTPFYLEGEEKMIPWSTLDAVADSAIQERVASRSEIDRALDSLRRYSEQADTLIVGPLRYQVFARKPGSN
jgi:ubiquinone/menaquinone biosynthesis C-methylase UbiE